MADTAVQETGQQCFHVAYGPQRENVTSDRRQGSVPSIHVLWLTATYAHMLGTELRSPAGKRHVLLTTESSLDSQK